MPVAWRPQDSRSHATANRKPSQRLSKLTDNRVLTMRHERSTVHQPLVSWLMQNCVSTESSRGD